MTLREFRKDFLRFGDFGLRIIPRHEPGFDSSVNDDGEKITHYDGCNVDFIEPFADFGNEIQCFKMGLLSVEIKVYINETR